MIQAIDKTLKKFRGFMFTLVTLCNTEFQRTESFKNEERRIRAKYQK